MLHIFKEIKILSEEEYNKYILLFNNVSKCYEIMAENIGKNDINVYNLSCFELSLREKISNK